jgi:hypothetical protein
MAKGITLSAPLLKHRHIFSRMNTVFYRYNLYLQYLFNFFWYFYHQNSKQNRLFIKKINGFKETRNCIYITRYARNLILLGIYHHIFGNEKRAKV